jgi:S1-C subfamily serine protease
MLVAAILAAGAAGCGGGGGGGSDAQANSQTVSLQRSFLDAVHAIQPAVVQIRTDQGLGSGIVFDDKGDVVTNAHVVGNARQVVVTSAKGRRYQGKVLDAFVPNDVAVVHVDTSDLKPAQFADSSELQVGQIVMAVGNPLGLRSSVTNGIVSALGRTVSEPGGATLPDTIQTSAPINPGNSGGALVDLQGRVIGIPTLAAIDRELGGSAAPGIGFAIPSSTVRDLAQQIVDKGHVVDSHRAYLGVQLASTTAANGAIVAAVQQAGPAATAGIKAGDVIVSIDGHQTPAAGAVASALAQLKPGETAKVTVAHGDGSRDTFDVKLGQIPG